MIEVKNVSRRFDNFKAVDGISFSIRTGEIVGLLGPNGAGKTTTMRMITGYLDPTEGCVEIDGINVAENPVEAKRKIGYMPESAPVYSDMMVQDYLEYVADIEGVDAAEKVPHLAEICGLSEVMHKNVGELSRGNKQRVGLAHALMNDPEILILDEPTSGLDPNQVQQVRNLIKKIGETRTVIISTHILSEVEMLCSRVIIISDGKKVADGPTADLREKSGSSVQIELLVDNADPVTAGKILTETAGVASVKLDSVEERTKITVSVEKDAEIRPELAKICVNNGWNLYGMEMKRNSLEDVFTILTNGGDKK